jgi:hypothetical protein
MEVGRDRRVSVVGRAGRGAYRRALLFSRCPYFGSGMRVKIQALLARSCGVDDLGYGGMRLYRRAPLVADDPGTSRPVVRLAGDELLARRLTKNARRLAEQKYDWRCVGQALDVVYDGLSSGRVLRLPSPAQMGFAS